MHLPCKRQTAACSWMGVSKHLHYTSRRVCMCVCVCVCVCVWWAANSWQLDTRLLKRNTVLFLCHERKVESNILVMYTWQRDKIVLCLLIWKNKQGKREQAMYSVILKKNISIPQDMCTYLANGNGNWMLDGRVEIPSRHLFDVEKRVRWAAKFIYQMWCSNLLGAVSIYDQVRSKLRGEDKACFSLSSSWC